MDLGHRLLARFSHPLFLKVFDQGARPVPVVIVLHPQRRAAKAPRAGTGLVVFDTGFFQEFTHAGNFFFRGRPGVENAFTHGHIVARAGALCRLPAPGIIEGLIGNGESVERATESPVWALERLDDKLRVVIEHLPFTIGRGKDCHLQPASVKVSRLHAQLMTSTLPGFLFLRDHESTNGTCVNETRMTEPVPVGDGDVLRFADEDWVLLDISRDDSNTRKLGTTRLRRPMAQSA